MIETDNIPKEMNQKAVHLGKQKEETGFTLTSWKSSGLLLYSNSWNYGAYVLYIQLMDMREKPFCNEG